MNAKQIDRYLPNLSQLRHDGCCLGHCILRLRQLSHEGKGKDKGGMLDPEASSSTESFSMSCCAVGSRGAGAGVSD